MDYIKFNYINLYKINELYNNLLNNTIYEKELNNYK